MRDRVTERLHSSSLTPGHLSTVLYGWLAWFSQTRGCKERTGLSRFGWVRNKSHNTYTAWHGGAAGRRRRGPWERWLLRGKRTHPGGHGPPARMGTSGPSFLAAGDAEWDLSVPGSQERPCLGRRGDANQQTYQ